MGHRKGGLIVRIAIIVMLAITPMLAGGCFVAGMNAIEGRRDQANY